MWAPAGSDWQAEYLGLDSESSHNEWPPVKRRRTAEAPSPFAASPGSGAANVYASSGTAHPAGFAAPENSFAPAPAVDSHEQASELRVPTAAELPVWIARVIEVHGAEVVVPLLLRSVPPSKMQELCDLAWGVRSDDEQEMFARAGIGEAPVVRVSPRTAPRPVALLDRQAAFGTPVGMSGMIYQQCWCCQPEFGRQDEREQCEAMNLLASLEADLKEATERVADEEAESGVAAAVRKNARYYMYRRWVGEQWGLLGKGKRIRIQAS